MSVKLAISFKQNGFYLLLILQAIICFHFYIDKVYFHKVNKCTEQVVSVWFLIERERERDYQAFEYAQAPNPPLPSHIEPAE